MIFFLLQFFYFSIFNVNDTYKLRYGQRSKYLSQTSSFRLIATVSLVNTHVLTFEKKL